MLVGIFEIEAVGGIMDWHIHVGDALNCPFWGNVAVLVAAWAILVPTKVEVIDK